MDTQQILVGAQDALTARRVFGEPIHAEGATIIPVAVVRGGGGGGDRQTQQGVGFGLQARPAGVYVVRNGEDDHRERLRGVNARVVRAGVIRTGDVVRKVARGARLSSAAV